MLLKYNEIENQLNNLEIPTLIGLYTYEIKYSFADKRHLAYIKEFASLACDSDVYRNRGDIPLYHLDFIIEDIQGLVADVIQDLLDSKEDIPLPEWVVDDNTKSYLFHLVGLTGSTSSSLHIGTN